MLASTPNLCNQYPSVRECSAYLGGCTARIVKQSVASTARFASTGRSVCTSSNVRDRTVLQLEKIADETTTFFFKHRNRFRLYIVDIYRVLYSTEKAKSTAARAGKTARADCAA